MKVGNKFEIKSDIVKFFLIQVFNIMICLLFIFYGCAVWETGYSFHRSTPGGGTIAHYAGNFAKPIALVLIGCGLYLLYSTIKAICRR